MSKSTENTNDARRLDRPSETATFTRVNHGPWDTTDRRGALNLARDGSQHRRFHSLFEDMLN